ncbi:MAG: hypothetical protein ACFFBP_06230 [Promethearchaeota archaeon]
MEKQRNRTVMEKVDYETVIYSELRDYLNSNKILKLNEVIPFLTGRIARSSLNLNKVGITKILKSFIDRNIIVEGSKLTREDVLTNPKRRIIYEFINQNPGTYYYQIIKELEMGSHLVIWHVEILLEFNFINMIEEDNHELYFNHKTKPDMAKLIYYRTNEKSKKILAYLKSNNTGVTKTEISKNLDMHPTTVKKYIEILKKHQLIHSLKDKYKTLYLLDEL